jgi:hypothetical protein
MSEVREWLRRNNLEQYADAFEANDFSPIISQRLDRSRRPAITACVPATVPLAVRLIRKQPRISRPVSDWPMRCQFLPIGRAASSIFC